MTIGKRDAGDDGMAGMAPAQPSTATSRRSLAQSFAKIKGSVRLVQLRDGLAIHLIDVEHLDDLASGLSQPAGVGIYLNFEDEEGLDSRVGGRPLPIGRHRTTDGRPFGFMIWRRHAADHVRRAPRGTRTRAAIVWLSPEWIEATFGLHNEAFPMSAREHLAISRWFPSRRLATLVEGLFDPSGSAALYRLRQETVAIEIVGEAVATIRPPAGREGQRTQMLLLNKARDLIDTDLAHAPTAQSLAAGLGIGIGTLRHLFRDAYGCTIVEYIRVRRLDAARAMIEEGKAVSVAAAFAGYTSPANFSTAFRRHFGITPRQARAGA